MHDWKRQLRVISLNKNAQPTKGFLRASLRWKSVSRGNSLLFELILFASCTVLKDEWLKLLKVTKTRVITRMYEKAPRFLDGFFSRMIMMMMEVQKKCNGKEYVIWEEASRSMQIGVFKNVKHIRPRKVWKRVISTIRKRIWPKKLDLTVGDEDLEVHAASWDRNEDGVDFSLTKSKGCHGPLWY